MNIYSAFTLGMTCFAAFFTIHEVLKRIYDVIFFKFLHYLFAGLLLTQCLALLDNLFDELIIINYDFLLEMNGIPNKSKLGVAKIFSYIDYYNITGLNKGIYRIPGVSGTPYASGGLVSAIFMYFLINRSHHY